MRVVDAIAEILKLEQIEWLPSYPTTTVIEAAAASGIRPVVCRQERVGVGIADGYARVKNGSPVGAFAMQYGPGAENAFAGVATAFSDSVPVLLLPLGHPRNRQGVFPYFSSMKAYDTVTKYSESISVANSVGDVMRRAFSALKMGRKGPVLVEIPADVAGEEVDESVVQAYRPGKASLAAPDSRDVDQAAAELLAAQTPVIVAGQGVLYAGATEDLVALAEALQAPVMTTLEGKSAFPENHPLSLGTGAGSVAGPVVHFMTKADVVLGIGTSFTRHGMNMTIPAAGKVMIQATNDPRDIHKDYFIDHPIIGDAKLVAQSLLEAVKDRLGGKTRDGSVAAEIEQARTEWLGQWMPKLTSDEVPITPYRVIWELMQNLDPASAIVTHDSGSPRDQMVPFYRATAPRSYLGWGKSHGLGTGLGLTIGAKMAAPDKMAINWMGDAAFGMVGLDFETAVRCGLPITTIVSNNSSMAIEINQMAVSHELYGTRNVGGAYADMGRAMGGYAERVTDPSEVGPAILRAREANLEGKAALLEIITSEETAFSHRRPFG